MTEQEIIDKVCDRVVNTINYNELDYYMFEELWFEETNDEYVKYADKLIKKSTKKLNKMTEQQAIEAIANDIQDGIYGWTQKCGTEWQKWTYSLNQARKIYEGKLIIDLENGKYE